jgi:hypothetical protein
MLLIIGIEFYIFYQFNKITHSIQNSIKVKKWGQTKQQR